MFEHGIREYGKTGEDLALAFLKKKGYKWIMSNFRTKWGEIDLVMQDGPALVFVEVKSRRGEEYGEPEEAVTPVKKNHMAKAAFHFLQKAGREESLMRFDVVSLGPSGIRHYEDAFQMEGDFYL